MQEHITLLNVRVDKISSEELLSEIEESVHQHKKKVFAYLTAHALNVAGKDNEFKEFLNNADVSFADGEGVRLGAKILGETLPPRIPLTRWIWELAEFCEKKGFSIFLLGASKKKY